MAGLEGQESIAEKFGSCAVGERPLTVRELIDTPLQDWMAKAGEGCMPSDMSNFSRNMDRQIDRNANLAEHNVTHQMDRMFKGEAPKDPSRGNANISEIYETAKESALDMLGVDSEVFDTLSSREQRTLLQEKLEGFTPEQIAAFSAETSLNVANMSEAMKGGYQTQLQEVIDKLNEPAPEPEAPATPEADTIPRSAVDQPNTIPV